MALVRAYESLNLDDKLSELKALANALSFSDSRLLLDLVHSSRGSFKCDIFGKVPVEICALIARHLPWKVFFQAQGVSRAWRDRLSSPSVRIEKLLPWHAEVKSPGADLDLLCRRAAAWSWGRPNQRIGIDIEKRGAQFAYSYNLLACKTEDARSIGIYDLALNRVSFLTTPKREVFARFAISRTMLAAVTWSGSCCIWKTDALHGHPAETIQLESAHVEDLTMTLTAVALEYYQTIPSHQSQVLTNTNSFPYAERRCLDSMLIWIPSTRRIKHFPVPRASELHLQGRIFSDVEQSVTLIGWPIYYDCKSVSDSKITVLILDFEGNLLYENTQDMFQGDFTWRSNRILDDGRGSTILAYRRRETERAWSIQLCRYDRQSRSLQFQNLSGPGQLGAGQLFFHRVVIVVLREGGLINIINHADSNRCHIERSDYHLKQKRLLMKSANGIKFIGGDDDDNFLLVDYGYAYYELLCFNSSIDVQLPASVLNWFAILNKDA